MATADVADAVVEICSRLEGIPLAIELAASRMASMTASEVRDRLDQRFKLLVGSRRGLERHQTLRHAVAWSYDLLDDAEKTVLKRCSVFAGGFDFQSACAVAGSGDDYAVLDLLDALESLRHTAGAINDRVTAAESVPAPTSSEGTRHICSSATPKPSRLVAKNLHCGRVREDCLDQVGDGVAQVLAVVEHQQPDPARQRCRDALGHTLAGLLRGAQHRRDRVGHRRRISHRRQFEKPRHRGIESFQVDGLARLEAKYGDPLAALDYLSLAIRNYHDSGNVTLVHSPLAVLAALFHRLGHHEAAATIAGFAFNPLDRRVVSRDHHSDH